MNKIKIIISFLLSFFFIFSVIPLSSQAQAYNYVNSQYLAINPYYLFNSEYTDNNSNILDRNVVLEIESSQYIIQFYNLYVNHNDRSTVLVCGKLSTENRYVLILNQSVSWYFSVLDKNSNSWSSLIPVDLTILPYLGNATVRNNASSGSYLSYYLSFEFYNSITLSCNHQFPQNTFSDYSELKSCTLKDYVPDIITAAVILGLQNSGGSGSGSVDTTNIINAIIQARESIIDSVEDGDDYTQSLLILLAEILYGDLSGNDNEPSVEDILDSGAINILDYYFKDYFNQLYNRYKNENNQIVNSIWQALNTGNAVNASDNVAAINALKAAIRDEIANSGQLSYIEYISYIVDYLDVFYMALYNQNTEILQKVDRLLTISSSNTATITNRIQQSENNIIDGINDAGENTGSPDLSHTGLDSALSQGSGWAAQILSASSVIDQATQNVANYLDSGSSILNAILTSFPIFGVIISFVLVFYLVRKVIGR